jgi:Spy/CpxP family protein refolding chaperone
MSKWKISLYLVALFLAGVVTGAFLTHQVGKRIMMKMMRPEAMAEHWRHDLEGKLSLTAEQSRKIAPIIADGMNTFRSGFHDQMQLTLSNCNALIAVELTPEQRTKFAEIEREQQEFIRSRLKNGDAPKGK